MNTARARTSLNVFYVEDFENLDPGTGPYPRASMASERVSRATYSGNCRVIQSTVWRRYTSIVRHSPALLIRGILERGDGDVTSLLADQLDILDLAIAHPSRDFR